MIYKDPVLGSGNVFVVVVVLGKWRGEAEDVLKNQVK